MIIHPITAVDTHAHVFCADLPMVSGRRYSPDHDATVESYVAQLGAHGISHGVLIQPSFLGTDNGFMLAALRRFPDRLRGVAVIDTGAPEEEMDHLASAGVTGVRLNLVGRPAEDYADPQWQRFFHRIANRDWQIEVQRPMEDLAAVAGPMLAAGVTVVIDHFGLPDGPIDPARPGHGAFLDLMSAPNLWMKLSAPYRARLDTAEAKAALDLLREAAGGSERFLWGSDWPHTQHEAETDYAAQVRRRDELLTDPAERQAVLIDNPARLFGFA